MRRGKELMDWIKQIEDDYSQMSNEQIYELLLDFIDYKDISSYEDICRSTILDEVAKRMGV